MKMINNAQYKFLIPGASFLALGASIRLGSAKITLLNTPGGLDRHAGFFTF